MIKAVIFDVDGVLLDSLESNTQFFQKLLVEFGYQGPTLEQYRGMHNLPMWDVIRVMTGLTDEKEIEKIWKRGHQPIPGADMIPLVPADAPAALKELRKNYALAIVTGRIRQSIFGKSEGMAKLESYFKAAVGYEDTKNHKPHPDPLLLAAERLGVQPHECVYVGDASTDVEAGNAAGMKVFIYGQKNLLGAAGLARNFAELPGIVAQL